MPLSELRRYTDAVGDSTSFNLINLVRDDIVVKGSRAEVESARASEDGMAVLVKLRLCAPPPAEVEKPPSVCMFVPTGAVICTVTGETRNARSNICKDHGTRLTGARLNL